MKAIKKVLFAVFFSIMYMVANAQLDRQWINTYTTADSAYMNVVCLLDGGNGNVIKATMTTKYIVPNTYNTLLLQKIDESGSVIWDEVYTHPVYNGFSIYDGGRDAAGNLYFGGQLVINSQVANWFVISFDALGQVRWTKNIVENQYTSGYSRTLKVDAAGNVYASGSVNGSGESYGVIVKYDNNGNELWVKKATNAYDYGIAMLIAANGDLVACNGDYEFTRFSPAGNVLWSTPDTAAFIYVSPSIIESADGSIYGISFLGYSYSLKKLSSTGTFEWNKSDFPEYWAFGDNSVRLGSDAQGNIYAAGLNTSDTIYQTAVYKYTPSGQEIWNQTFQNGSIVNFYDVYDLLTLPNGNIVVSGVVYDPNYYGGVAVLNGANGDVLDMDVIDSVSFSLQEMVYNSGGLYVVGNGNYNTSLAKYAASVSIKENEDANQLLDVFPNPFAEAISIQSEFIITRYELRNVAGQLIKSANANGNITLQLSDISSGVYLLNVYGNDDQQAVRRIIKR